MNGDEFYPIIPPNNELSPNWKLTFPIKNRSEMIYEIYRSMDTMRAQTTDFVLNVQVLELSIFKECTTMDEYYQLGAARVFNFKKISRLRLKVLQPQPVVPSSTVLFSMTPSILQYILQPSLLKLKTALEPHLDFGLIMKKLERSEYSEPWQYIENVTDVLDEGLKAFKKSSAPFVKITEHSEGFNQEINGIMNDMGYCCGNVYRHNSNLVCCKEGCTISWGTRYYKNTSGGLDYCLNCFGMLNWDGVEGKKARSGFTSSINKIRKLEKMINCRGCNRTSHNICVRHFDSIWTEGFFCPQCCNLNGGISRREPNPFTAKNLQTTELSVAIESHVNLFKNRMSYSEDDVTGDILIRVVEESVHQNPVLPELRKCISSPKNFPYQNITVYAFQEQDDAEICFFGFEVQEYGSVNCPMPNRNTAYIAYLDSIPFVKPQRMRTALYMEILLAYLKFAKEHGFETIHLWSCPPKKGVDYMFHCHPPSQKIPSPKILFIWYFELFTKGLYDKIIMDFMTLQQFVEKGLLQSLKQLPYFKGDYWPNVIEDLISATVNGLQKHKRDFTADDVLHKAFLKFKSLPKTIKDAFFVVRLNSGTASFPELQDRSTGAMNADRSMGQRDRFFTLALENNYEFSSYRRARYSTMGMLLDLHHRQNQIAKEEFDKTLSFLVHSFNCDVIACQSPHCTNFQNFFRHSKACAKGRNGKCKDCNNFRLILHYHSRSCDKAVCAVPLCSYFRNQVFNSV